MGHFIIDLDTGKYVYMCDSEYQERLFALTKEEYNRFRSIYAIYETYENVLKMPETYTVKVYQLTEVAEKVYELQNMKEISYPVKRIYYAIPQRYEVEMRG